MNDPTHGLVSRLARLVSTAIGRARVTTTNDSGNVQFVQVQVNDLETIDNLPRVAEFGLTSVAPDGSDVVMVNLGGGRNNAVVVATGHQESRPKGLKAGETMLYSQNGKYVYLTASGGISVFANGEPVNVAGASTVTINASEKIRAVTPRLECTGDIVDNCDTNGRSMADDRELYDSHKHVLHEVQSGSSDLTTDIPTVIE